MNKDAIKRDLDAIKFVMTRTTDPVEKQNLATLGIELNAIYLQCCGYLTFFHDNNLDPTHTSVLAFDFLEPIKRKRIKKKIALRLQ